MIERSKGNTGLTIIRAPICCFVRSPVRPSIRWSVGLSVSRTFTSFINFKSFKVILKEYKVILSHSKSICKSTG